MLFFIVIGINLCWNRRKEVTRLEIEHKDDVYDIYSDFREWEPLKRHCDMFCDIFTTNNEFRYENDIKDKEYKL